MTNTIDTLFENDSFLGDPNDLDNLVEFRDEPETNSDNDNDRAQEEDKANEDNPDEDNPDEDKPEKKDDKKIVRVKRPQPKLNPDRLKGPRGLLALPKAFADFKFYGKGHETEDLSRLLARLEHWGHRLFPKLTFDDFLENVEKLGTKKVVQAYLKRVRMGLEIAADSERIGSDQEEEEAEDNPAEPVPNNPDDEFDRLLAEQVSFYQNSSIASSLPPTPSPLRTPVASSSAPSSLTAEQRERIERNRLAAMEKRRNRAANNSTTALPPRASSLEKDTTADASAEMVNSTEEAAAFGTSSNPTAAVDKNRAPGSPGSQSSRSESPSRKFSNPASTTCSAESDLARDDAVVSESGSLRRKSTESDVLYETAQSDSGNGRGIKESCDSSLGTKMKKTSSIDIDYNVVDVQDSGLGSSGDLTAAGTSMAAIIETFKADSTVNTSSEVPDDSSMECDMSFKRSGEGPLLPAKKRKMEVPAIDSAGISSNDANGNEASSTNGFDTPAENGHSSANRHQSVNDSHQEPAC